VLGEGRGPNKKEAEQAAARDALERVERPGQRREEREEGEGTEREPRENRGIREPREARESRGEPRESPVVPPVPEREPADAGREGGRSRRGGRGRRGWGGKEAAAAEPVLEGPVPAREPVVERITRPAEVEPAPSVYEEDDLEEIGRPEGPLDERHVDPFGIAAAEEPGPADDVPGDAGQSWSAVDPEPAWEPSGALPEESATNRFEDEPGVGPWVEPQTEEGAEEELPGPGARSSEGGPAAEPRYGRRRTRRR
jgi:hypothetical protein